jgi:hypothetical protein
MLGVLIASSGNLLGVSEEVKTSRERDVLLAKQDGESTRVDLEAMRSWVQSHLLPDVCASLLAARRRRCAVASCGLRAPSCIGVYEAKHSFWGFFSFFPIDELRRAAARGAPREVGLGRGGVGGQVPTGPWCRSGGATRAP